VCVCVCVCVSVCLSVSIHTEGKSKLVLPSQGEVRQGLHPGRTVNVGGWREQGSFGVPGKTVCCPEWSV
jgi:hypothetical protein